MADVFISYSRKDIAFARLIREALQQSEIDPWIDWDRIPIGEKWWNEICAAIQAANTFVFIISKNSLGSPVCKDEINLALENHKRIIPIVVDDLDPDAVRKFVPDLPQINWVVFAKDRIFRLAENSESASELPEDRQLALPELPQFTEALEKLTKAIHTDWDWVKAHTNLQVDALRWVENQRNQSYLLRGEELAYAENLLLRAAGKEPQATGLQIEFVSASREEETRKSQENLRIQQEKLIAEQNASRRQRLVIWAVGLGLLVAATLGAVAWGQRNQYLAEAYVRGTAQSQAIAESNNRATAEKIALDQQATAEAASTQAVQQRDEAQHQAQLALASKLAAQSQLLSKEQIDLGLLLGVTASQTADTIEAQLSPRLALETSPRLRKFLKNDYTGPRPFAISPDGQTLAVVECTKYDTSKIPNVCIQSRLLLLDANTGLASGAPLDLGAFAAGYLAFNALDDGKTIILVGYTSVAIWDIKTGGLVGEYPTGDKDAGIFPTAAAFSPDGRLLAMVGCGDHSKGTDANGYCNLGEIRLWSIETRQLVGQPIAASESNVYALAFSPDSQILASAGDSSIKLWMLSGSDQNGEVTLSGDPIESPDIVIEALAFSPNGKLLASGGSEHKISLWDLASPQQPVAQLMGHTYWVSALQFSPDGKYLVSGGWDDSLLLWDLASRQAVEPQWIGHTEDVLKVSYKPDGEAIVSTDSSGNIILWNTSSRYSGSPLGRILASGSGSFVWTHAFSPDGNILAYTIDRTIYLWDMQKNQPLGTPLEGHQDNIRSLVFPPQDKGRTLVSASKDHVTMTWDVQTGQLLHQTGQDESTPLYEAAFSQDGSRLIYKTNQDLFIVDLTGANTRKKLSIQSADNRIWSIAMSLDGDLIAASVCDQIDANQECTAWSIQFWDPILDRSVGQAVKDLTKYPTAIALSSNGQRLAYSLDDRSSIYLFDRQAGIVQEEIITPPTEPGDIPMVTDLVFSPDGINVAASYLFESMVILWDAQTGRMVGSPFTDQSNIGEPAFSPDGKFIAWPLGGTYFLWDIAGQKPIGQALQKGDAGGSLVFSPEGKRVAMAGGFSKPTERGAQVFDTLSGAPITDPLLGHVDAVQALTFSGDGQQLVTLSRDNTLNIWDLTTSRLVAQPLIGYLGNYARVDLSPDGRTLAVVACKRKSGDECLESELWFQDTNTGELTLQPLVIEGSTVLVRFSHDGTRLAIPRVDGVMLWDVTAQKELFKFSVPSGDICSISFSPDDLVLAVRSKSVQLWDLSTGHSIGEPILDKTTSSQGTSLSSTEDWGLAFSPDGRWLATAGNESGSLMLVEVATGQPFGPLLIDQRNKLMRGTLISVSFSPDGKRLISGNNSGLVTLWNIDPAAWRELACSTAGRDLTSDEWAIYMPDSEPYRSICPVVGQD